MKYFLVRPMVLPVIVVGFVSMLVYWANPGENFEEYAATIKEARRQKGLSFRNDPDSPFGADAKKFDSLRYYPVNGLYRVKAKLDPIEKKQVRVLETSTGEKATYLEYGWAVFLLGGDENRLLILEVMDMGPSRGKLFLAFADETSASETYGAGRYLDLKKVPAATSIELDFNKAYNPYCAYNDSYSCPFPPTENNLRIAIRAGEKSYH